MMQAAVLYGKKDLRLDTVPIPTAGPGEIIVKVGAATTCGTDLKVYRRGYHAKMLKPPIPFGHEVAGVVSQVGEGVTRFKVGDRIVPMNSAPCGACYFCLHGQQNLCDDIIFNNGAYAEYMRIPARIVEKNTLPLPENIPFEHASITEPLACVLYGFEQTGAVAGDSMVVIGAGPIGLMFMHVAQLEGIDVIAVVKREDQIAAAKRFGARQVVRLADGVDTVAAVRELTPQQRGADVVVEAVATPLTWQWSVDMVRKGGVVNFFGGPPSATKVELDTNHLHYNDITLKASFHHTPATCRRALELITSGRFRAADCITAHAKLADLPAVFHGMLTRSERTHEPEIKTAILP
jgi:L-iditol 2-dehydrogenase